MTGSQPADPKVTTVDLATAAIAEARKSVGFAASAWYTEADLAFRRELKDRRSQLFRQGMTLLEFMLRFDEIASEWLTPEARQDGEAFLAGKIKRLPATLRALMAAFYEQLHEFERGVTSPRKHIYHAYAWALGCRIEKPQLVQTTHADLVALLEEANRNR